MCRVHLHTKSLQHLSPCYLSPHTLHTLPPNLTIMDYLPYSKPHHANHLLPCQPPSSMPTSARNAIRPTWRSPGESQRIPSPQLKNALLYENLPRGYKSYFHCSPHSSVVYKLPLLQYYVYLSPQTIKTTKDWNGILFTSVPPASFTRSNMWQNQHKCLLLCESEEINENSLEETIMVSTLLVSLLRSYCSIKDRSLN